MECWSDGVTKPTTQHSTTPALHSEIYSPERLLITSGSQQLLYMTTEALCDEGDIVLVEDPTYFVYLSILQSRGLRARAVRLERDGLDLAHLESVLQSLKRSGELRRVKMIYLVSYFQNPTGVTTSFEKKYGILKLLKKFERDAGHPIYLLEDAAYRELRFAGRDVPSALAADGAADRVIYAGTFTKPFATGARVGYGVLPEPVFTAVKHIKGNHDFGTANLLQQLFVRALASGIYEQQVARLQKRYAHKARVMKLAIKKHFPPAVEWWEPEGGLYFWARLPHDVPIGHEIKSFLDRAEKRRALCAGRNLLRRRPGAAQTEPRNAHQLRQRERGGYPRRHQAAGQGVEEICLTRSDARTHSGVKSLGPVGISTTSISYSLHRFCTDDATDRAASTVRTSATCLLYR